MSNVPPPLPPKHLRDPGDAWVEGPDGQKFWGRFGAAGLLLIDPSSRVLLQLRAGWSHSGGTWGIPGGALKMGESPLQAALREAEEEAGVPSKEVELVGSSTLDLDFWKYTTIIGKIKKSFNPIAGDLESEALEWVEIALVEERNLHPGFRGSWPELHTKILKL